MTGPAKSRQLRAYLVVAAVLFALVLDGLDLQLLSMVGPKVIEEWGLSTSAFSLALASAVLGVALGAALGGWLGDFFGHGKVLLWSIPGCALVTALTATAGDILAITAMRFFTGLAIGAISSSALVYVTQALTDRGRAALGAVTSACGSAGGMIGSGIVLAVEPAFGWRACFVVAGGAMAVTWLALVLLRTTGAAPRKAAGDALGRPRARWFDQARTPLFANQNARMNVGAPLAFAAATYIGYSFAWTPVILTQSGLPLSEAVLGYLAYNVMALVSPLATGIAISRVGSRRLMLLTALVGIAAAVILAQALLLHQAAPSFTIKLIIYLGIGGMGAVASILLAVMYGLVACGYPDGCRGRGVGLGMMAARIGGLAAILAGGLLLDTRFGPSGVFYVIACGLILVIAACFVIDRHVPSRSPPDLTMARA